VIVFGNISEAYTIAAIHHSNNGKEKRKIQIPQINLFGTWLIHTSESRTTHNSRTRPLPPHVHTYTQHSPKAELLLPVVLPHYRRKEGPAAAASAVAAAAAII
jgi:hypothetical protein